MARRRLSIEVVSKHTGWCVALFRSLHNIITRALQVNRFHDYNLSWGRIPQNVRASITKDVLGQLKLHGFPLPRKDTEQRTLVDLCLKWKVPILRAVQASKAARPRIDVNLPTFQREARLVTSPEQCEPHSPKFLAPLSGLLRDQDSPCECTAHRRAQQQLVYKSDARFGPEGSNDSSLTGVSVDSVHDSYHEEQGQGWLTQSRLPISTLQQEQVDTTQDNSSSLIDRGDYDFDDWASPGYCVEQQPRTPLSILSQPQQQVRPPSEWNHGQNDFTAQTPDMRCQTDSTDATNALFQQQEPPPPIKQPLQQWTPPDSRPRQRNLLTQVARERDHEKSANPFGPSAFRSIRNGPVPAPYQQNPVRKPQVQKPSLYRQTRQPRTSHSKQPLRREFMTHATVAADNDGLLTDFSLPHEVTMPIQPKSMSVCHQQEQATVAVSDDGCQGPDHFQSGSPEMWYDSSLQDIARRNTSRPAETIIASHFPSASDSGQKNAQYHHQHRYQEPHYSEVVGDKGHHSQRDHHRKLQQSQLQRQAHQQQPQQLPKQAHHHHEHQHQNQHQYQQQQAQTIASPTQEPYDEDLVLDSDISLGYDYHFQDLFRDI